MGSARRAFTMREARDHSTIAWPPAHSWLGSVVKPRGLEVMRDLFQRKASAVVPDDDNLLACAVVEAINAFVIHDADVVAASRRVAPILWEMGARHARNGGEHNDIEKTFALMAQTAPDALKFVLRSDAAGKAPAQLRAATVAYVHRLRMHVALGWERCKTLDGMSSSWPENPATATEHASSASKPSDATRLAQLRELYGVNPDDLYCALVAAGPTLGTPMLSHPEALTGDDCREVLIPAQLARDEIGEMLAHQAVLGPTVPLSDIEESTQLASRAAELLRESSVKHPAKVVPCADLLSALVLEGSPVLTRLMMDKHLAPFKGLGLKRRINVAELLLEHLLAGGPVSQAARNLGIPVQTAHSRMMTIRQMMGHALEDPNQRFELIIALRAALPRWRTES